MGGGGELSRAAAPPRASLRRDPIFEEEALGRVYDGQLLRRLGPYIAPHWRQVVTSLLLSLPIFALELAPAWLIRAGLDRVVPAAGAQEAADEASEPVFDMSWLEAVLEPAWGLPPLAWLAGLYLLAVGLGAAFQYRQLVLMAKTGQLAMRSLRGAIFRHLPTLHRAFFDRYPVGRLVTRATNDVENVAEMFSSGIVAGISDLAKMVGFAVVLWWIAPDLALASFLVVPLLAVCAVVFRWRIRTAFRQVRVRIARINAYIQEAITGMQEIQLFTREARNDRDFDAMNDAHRAAWSQSIRYDAALFAAVEVAGGLSVALIVGYGWGIASAGVLYQFIDYMRRFFTPLRDLSAKYSVMQSAMASLERIFQLLDTEPAIRDPAPRPGLREASPLRAADRAALGDGAEPPTRRAAGAAAAIAFENVWFSYDGQEWVLRDIDFRVAPGERVAFVGATGAGKTSLLQLLGRHYDVGRGRITLDGVDLRDLPLRDLRRRIAVVSQDVFLFSDTVAWNIGLGRPEVDRARIEAAARAVQAHPFIEDLPAGYDTELRERGGDLSSGQRQLLSFARALAYGADVLALDEATSSVDPETEHLVQRGLQTLVEGQTSLVVAHRLATIQDVDRIYVLHRGRIVESGRHAELLALDGYYHRLYRLQQAPQARAARPGRAASRSAAKASEVRQPG